LKGLPFLQTLKLVEGEIEIKAGTQGSEVKIKIWIDANHPVIHVTFKGQRNFEVSTSLELWRLKKRELKDDELTNGAYGVQGAPHPIYENPDIILPIKNNRITWYHQNIESIWTETMKLQGLECLITKIHDPLLNITFGGVVKGDNFTSKNKTTLKSIKPRKYQHISIYLLNTQKTPEEWHKNLKKQIEEIDDSDFKLDYLNHKKWWQDFWNKSWIIINGTNDSEVVTQGYILQRFINACSGRGSYPIKFNGSIFTVDATKKGYNADYRDWGGPYWFQNTRLIYWPMPASGDFELMKPLFHMYLEALPLAKERTKLYFQHEGAFFPETMYFWGTYVNCNYGWDRRDKSVAYIQNLNIRYYYQGGLELIALLLDYYTYTLDEEFAKNIMVPLAESIIKFYNQHYPRKKRGKKVFAPAQALETCRDCINPLPVVAGLKFVLTKLLLLNNKILDEEVRNSWKHLLREIPSIPKIKVDEEYLLSPAEKIETFPSCSENPELYAIFPYRLFGVDKPNIKIAKSTFAKRQFKGDVGWEQNVIQAAYLGLAREAQKMITKRFATKNKESRFPAFWGPNYDWTPDQDHGNVGTMALQIMLLQTENEKINLFPAWPKEWNVMFKLHAPKKTIIEGIYEDGSLKKFKVTPRNRIKDIIIHKPK
jgi:hypothetical protein